MADWTPVIQAAAELVTTIAVPWFLIEYRRRTGINLADQQRASIYHAVDTAAGLVQTELDQGKISVADLKPEHPAVQAEAIAALRSVPDAAEAQNATVEFMARKIVAQVDTSPKVLTPLALGQMPAPWLAPAAPASPAPPNPTWSGLR